MTLSVGINGVWLSFEIFLSGNFLTVKFVSYVV